MNAGRRLEDRSQEATARVAGPAELPVTLAFGAIDYASVLATPTSLEAWALGFSYGEGLIDRRDQVEKIEIDHLRHGLLVRLTVGGRIEQRAQEQRRVGSSTSSCGRCGSASEASMMLGLHRLAPSVAPDVAVLEAALEWLEQERRTGLHVALGLGAGGERLGVGVDIGRHNALDKLIGQAMLDQRPMPSLVMLSSRCSLELVQKVVRAGIPALATLSVPSDLAVETARLCGLQLIHCHRGERLVLLSGELG
ncbi:formate dehydrogenase accessory sulfurtransferase FdhD [Halotalea alkalilenta]|uniref:Formate dehydrogenase n=1 Tax=Halotalea alkalilenta TaxID=376489 RepID=A0A172YIY9_9GAMM|nr:formate dehydrogenase accessory sulfurtransferase FdhD [Halotalea alkalilenta]ANF59188.1 formate dehydrogenase [Halotalea alkalilenta]